MLTSFDSSGVIAAGSTWFGVLLPALYVAAGLGISFVVINWIAARFRSRGGKRRGRK